MPEVGRKANPKNAHAQSVVFDAKWDEKRAKAWCAKHGYVTDGMHKAESGLRFRQYDPDQEAFKYRSKDLGNGVSILMGFPMKQTAGKAEFIKALFSFASPELRWEQGEDGLWTVYDVPLFGVGTWNKKDFDQSFCEKVVAATNAMLDRVKPRLGFGHAPKGLTGEELESWQTQQPRLGLLAKVKMVGKRIYTEAIRAIPDWLKRQIDEGTWGPVSVEMTRIPDLGWAIDHVGLLGAKAPAVPWAGVDAFADAGERMVFMLGEGSADDVEKSGDDVAGEPASPETREFEQAEEVEPGTAEGDSMDEKELKAALENAAQAKAEAEKATADAKAQLEAVEEEKRRLHASKIDGYCERLVEAGKATPGEVEEFKAIATTMNDSNKLKFADGERTALEGYFRDWMARPDRAKNTKGSSGTPEGEAVDVLTFFETEAEKLIESRGLSFADALGEAHKAHPDKFEQYKSERVKPLHKR